MNNTKTHIFSRDSTGNHVPFTLPVIEHTTEGPVFHQVESRPPSECITYLGVHINLELSWDRVISDLSSMVGWYRHLISANSLSTGAAVYLINHKLGPKLEYRLRFVDVPESKLRQWDESLTIAVNNTYNSRVRTQKHALLTLATD